MYASIYGPGLFRSTDDGITWSRVADAPAAEIRAVEAGADGVIFVATADGIHRYAGDVADVIAGVLGQLGCGEKTDQVYDPLDVGGILPRGERSAQVFTGDAHVSGQGLREDRSATMRHQ